MYVYCCLLRQLKCVRTYTIIASTKQKEKGLYTMTVKEAIGVLKSARDVRITWGSFSLPICKDDPLQMDAFGNYVVDEIEAVDTGAGAYEITIAMVPVKEG